MSISKNARSLTEPEAADLVARDASCDAERPGAGGAPAAAATALARLRRAASWRAPSSAPPSWLL